ncbi:tetracycline resistance protein [Calothrix sp. NIES-4071]|nr:tetracycline resistance protein [Calothrix sp. NIES-4071]BAZ57353.1 tetracycline resistance protein [Calothrix sp. NIES-4105]
MKLAKRKPPAVLVILALWLMVLASSSQATIVAPILPRIGEALNIPSAWQGSLVTGYSVALSLFAIIIGPVSDRLGRRPVLLAGTSLMAVMLLMHGFANDFISLLTVRIGAGVSGGILTGVAVAYVGDYFPYEQRGWANGWVMSGFAFGQVAAVPVGTILAERYGFRAPFFLFAVIAVVSFFLIFVIIPQPPIKRLQERLSVKTALQDYWVLLQEPKVKSAAGAYATMLFAVSTFVVFFPTWLEKEFQMSPSATATLFMVGGIANILVGPQAGRWSDKIGRKPIIIASCVTSAVLFTATPFIVTGTLSAYTVFFLVMILLALRLSPLQALLTTLVPDHQRGSLMSLVVAIGQLGGGLGGIAAGFAYAQFGYIGNAFVSAIFIALTGLIVSRGLQEP